MIIDQHITDRMAVYHGDAVEVARQLPSNSIDLTITSPPFSSLYTFSNSVNDMSNCKSHKEFFEHLRYLIEELYRITKKGRLCCIHTMDLTTGIGRDGYLSVIDFGGCLIRAFQRFGWIYHTPITIWKNPVVEVTRTKNIQLLYKQTCKDATISRMALPDRILVFRKPGINQSPVIHDKNEWTPNDWGKIASPIWMDINQTKTLNKSNARDSKDEKHISALQLDVIYRLMHLWSNPGDVVYDPFGGIGSTGYVALQNGRRTLMSELKESYYKQNVLNCQSAINSLGGGLFDLASP